MNRISTFKQWLVDTGERVGSTLALTAITFLLAADTIDAGFWKGLAATLVVGGVNVLKAALFSWMPVLQVWWQDAAVRVLWTFAIVGSGQFVSTEWLDLISVDFWQGVAVAGGTAALTLLKTIIAKRVGGDLSPASLVDAPPDVPPPGGAE